MMEKFTASNGVEILESGFDHKERPVMSLMCREREDVIMSERQFPAHHWDALREFFRHERDEELGRWRWPENPDYVVYSTEVTGANVALGSGYQECVVIDESTGFSQGFGSELPNCHGGNPREAARAYFAAHPESKPWHDAKPGEVWVLTVEGETYCWGVGDGPDLGRFIYAGGTSNIPLEHPSITKGRRIFPEVSDA